MTCFSPLQGYKSKALTKNGKHRIVFNPRDGLANGMVKMSVPCGQCVGCRLDYSRQWAVRCMHEAKMHEHNSFITLTYNDKFLPKYGSLNYDHWTRFMKRLRKRFSDLRFRFYMGPEYGEKFHRPHYHALLFGLDFPDKKLFKEHNGYKLFTSEILNSVWSCPKYGEPYGFASVGSVTFESAAYVARYMMKKVKGEDHMMRYFSKDIDFDSGEIFPIEVEKARMSNKPGIGKDWYDLYGQSDCHAHDYVILDGRKVRPPKYYDSIYQKIDPAAYDAIKELRVQDAAKFSLNNTPERLEVRRIVKEAQLNRLVRNLDV